MKIYANRALDLITRDCNRHQLQATKIKYKMNTLIPLLKTRSHGTHLFSFRFYEYVFHSFPYMHEKKKFVSCFLLFVYFSDICYICVTPFSVMLYKNSCLWISCYGKKPECKSIYLMVFNFSGYPHAILPYIYYTFYRRKENFIKLIWKNTFCEIERSKFNIIGIDFMFISMKYEIGWKFMK